MSNLNYVGRVDICNQQFSFVNVSFSLRQVSDSSENIFGGNIKKRKGWRKFCNVDIFMTNKNGESDSLDQVITNLKNLMSVGVF